MGFRALVSERFRLENVPPKCSGRRARSGTRLRSPCPQRLRGDAAAPLFSGVAAIRLRRQAPASGVKAAGRNMGGRQILSTAKPVKASAVRNHPETAIRPVCLPEGDPQANPGRIGQGICCSLPRERSGLRMRKAEMRLTPSGFGSIPVPACSGSFRRGRRPGRRHRRSMPPFQPCPEPFPRPSQRRLWRPPVWTECPPPSFP